MDYKILYVYDVALQHPFGPVWFLALGLALLVATIVGVILYKLSDQSASASRNALMVAALVFIGQVITVAMIFMVMTGSLMDRQIDQQLDQQSDLDQIVRVDGSIRNGFTAVDQYGQAVTGAVVKTSNYNYQLVIKVDSPDHQVLVYAAK